MAKDNMRTGLSLHDEPGTFEPRQYLTRFVRHFRKLLSWRKKTQTANQSIRPRLSFPPAKSSLNPPPRRALLRYLDRALSDPTREYVRSKNPMVILRSGFFQTRCRKSFRLQFTGSALFFEQFQNATDSFRENI